MVNSPSPEEVIKVADDASPQKAVGVAGNESPGGTRTRTGVGNLGMVIGILGIVIGLADVAVTLFAMLSPQIRVDPRVQFLIICIGYAVSMLFLMAAIWISSREWVRLICTVLVLLVSLGAFFFIRSFEANLSHDESEYNFELDNQDWTVGTLVRVS